MFIRRRKTILDPVDVVTGEVYSDRVDFSLPGPIPLQWKAYYSSQYKADGPLGWGWMFSYDRYLAFEGEAVGYVNGEGSVCPFPTIPGAGQAVPDLDERMTLHRVKENAFDLVLPDNLIIRFGGPPSAGRAKLERISNRNGMTVQFEYNSLGHLGAVYDSAGRTLRLQTDAQGRVLFVMCFRGGASGGSAKLATYEYDSAGNLMVVRDAMGYAARYEYDNEHRLVKRTDRNGYSFHYRHESDRCAKTWGDDGLFTGEFTYEPEKRRTFYKGFDDRRIEYRYDKNGMVTEEVDSYGRSTKTQYDDKGNVAVVLDRCARATVFKYDDHANKVEEISPTGETKKWVYDEHNQLLEAVDERGRKTTYSYDERGNLIREETPDGPVTTHKYDADGHRVLTQFDGLPLFKHEYDVHHQLVTTRSALTGDPLQEFTYDLFGSVTGVKDETGWTRRSYDATGRILSVSYANGTVEKLTYDREGNVTSDTCLLGNTWRHRYKGCRQLMETIAPDGGTTRYDYTRADERCRVIDPIGNVTEYIYDLCDRIVEEHRNGVMYERRQVDPEGRTLKRQDDLAELIAEFEYGTFDAPVARRTLREGKNIEAHLTYDKAGNLVEAANDFGRVKRAWDDAGRLAAESLDDSGVRYQYDEQGRLVCTSYNNGVEFALRWQGGDAVAVRDPAGGWHAWYYFGGKITKRCLANNLVESIEYDDDDRPIRHSLRGHDGGARALYDRRFSYNAMGHVIRIREGETEQVLEYDVCGRLVRSRTQRHDAGEVDEEYLEYDAAGNLLPPQSSLGGTILTGNRLAAWGERRFTYDHRGRLWREQRRRQTFVYEYDSEDRLVAVRLPDGQTVSYEYDPLGRRVSKQLGGARTIYGWDGDRLSWEEAVDGTRRYYLYAGPEETCPVMFCDAGLSVQGQTELAAYSIHYDHGQRPFLVTDAQGDVVWSACVSAYGRTTVRPDSVVTLNLRAPGQYFDAETGFHYNYHRYYDPEIGRYLQPDPIGLEGGLNLYAYAEGNPLRNRDVLGLAVKCVDKLSRRMALRISRLRERKGVATPAAVKELLRRSGFTRVKEGRSAPGTRCRPGEDVTPDGGSEIWKAEGKDGRVVYVRIDEHGHDLPSTQAGAREPHYHVDVLDNPDADASPMKGRALDEARETGTPPLDGDNVPLDSNGQRLTAEQNYEQRFEESRVPINRDGDRCPPPGTGASNAEWDAWADATHM